MEHQNYNYKNHQNNQNIESIKPKIAVVGGDLRMIYAALELSKIYEVAIYGHGGADLGSIIPPNSSVTRGADLSGTLRHAKVVLLPLPYATQNESYIHTPLLQLGRLSVENLFSSLEHGTLVIGGRFSQRAKQLSRSKNARFIDYEENEEIVKHGAVATAEGAIAIAMSNMSSALMGNKVGVFGFGRCGKEIASRLRAWGCEVCVFARDTKSAQEQGFNCVNLQNKDSLLSILNSQILIFNTIPAQILDREKLAALNTSTVIVDIASAPGGVDFETASELGILAILALGIPGKAAPKSSGEVLAAEVARYLSGEV